MNKSILKPLEKGKSSIHSLRRKIFSGDTELFMYIHYHTPVSIMEWQEITTCGEFRDLSWLLEVIKAKNSWRHL